jgi:cobalt-zinc-cadmium efflux system protein
VAGALVWWTGLTWIDPLTSLVVTAVIGFGSWGLLRDSLHLSLLAVPAGIDERAVRAHLAAQPGVCAVHDLHIWPMSTTETALTAHLVIPAGHPGDPFLHGLAAELAAKFKIGHATVQIETEEDADCALEPASVV